VLAQGVDEDRHRGLAGQQGLHQAAACPALHLFHGTGQVEADAHGLAVQQLKRAGGLGQGLQDVEQGFFERQRQGQRQQAARGRGGGGVAHAGGGAKAGGSSGKAGAAGTASARWR
jgi:hypothetical protein